MGRRAYDGAAHTSQETVMPLHTSVVFLHVLSAIFLVGHSFGTPLVLATIRRAPTTGALRTWLGFARDSSRFNPPVALVLLGTGGWLGTGRWDEGWIGVAAALWVASTVLAVAIVKKVGEQVAALATGPADAPVPPAADALRRSTRWRLGAEGLIGCNLAALALMLFQPGLAGSVAVALGVTAGVVGALAALERRRAASTEAEALRPAAAAR
jgi:hypothetical protein